MTSQTPLFIISSGRTGSTMLAHMLNRHPDVLIVSDLFEPVGDEPYFHSERTASGREFWDILKRPSFPQRIRSWRRRPNAELLFLPDDDNLVSLLLSYTIPFLSGDPLKTFDELAQEVPRFPEDTLPRQTVRFFEHLRDKFGKPLWVERTGGSLPHTGRILDCWPNARVVHSFRDPREIAISMMRGSFFRLYLELENNPDLGEWDEEYFPPVEEMGAMLNRWVVDAMAALDSFPRDRQMDLRYEDIMATPEEALLSVISFLLEREINEPDREWARQEAATVRPAAIKFGNLRPDEQEALAAAVAPAMRRMGYG